MKSSELQREEKKVAEPWDLLRGRDIFKHGDQLQRDLQVSDLQHWGPNCCTFSRAREKPIPGVKNPPVPLRSSDFPEGIPTVVASLPASKQRKLNLDTRVANMAALNCLKAKRTGKYFTLEHPKNSIARDLESWKDLEAEEGVWATEYHSCMFKGSARRKAQILIHNIPLLNSNLNLICNSSRICTRTGKPHLSWKPRVEKGRVTSFATGLEREYPEGFCETYAQAIVQATQNPIQSFVEVFSGPNAPLSCALAKAWGVPSPIPPGTVTPPGPEKSELLDEHMEPQTSSSASASVTPVPRVPETALGETPTAESAPPRAQAVEAAKQPSFGKRQQLIPNGLNDAAAHLQQACKLQHPFSSMATLKTDHQESLKALAGNPSTLVRYRLEQLAKVRKLKVELAAEQRRANAKAAWTAQRLSTKPNTCLMEKLQTLLHIEDTEVPQLCLTGMRITGKAQTSPFFEPFEVRPVMSHDTFLKGCQEITGYDRKSPAHGPEGFPRDGEGHLGEDPTGD